MRNRTRWAAIVLIVLLAREQGFADTFYYDTNGATGGTSTSSTQNFTDSVWTLDPDGLTATTGYTPGSDVVFSADDNVNIGTGAQNVTITDTESTDGFSFDNGIVTLFGSGSPNLGIGAGGITVNSTDGATTFDSSLGTVTLSAGQSWNNDSTHALNVNSGVNGNGQTLTFNGSGSGTVNLNGLLSGSLNLIDDSATSEVYLGNGSNSFTGTITVAGGDLVTATASALGNNTIDLSNGGTVNFGSSDTQNIVLGAGGGNIISTGDDYFSGTITRSSPTSGPLNLISGDFITNSSDPNNDMGTVNVEGGRLLIRVPGAMSNNAVVNVDSGAIVDFDFAGSYANSIVANSGSAIETRSGGGMVLTDVTLPNSGSITIGSDDAGSGYLGIAGPAINLNGSLTLDINTLVNGGYGTQGTEVVISNQITGSGNLYIQPVTVTGPVQDIYSNGLSSLALNGNNTYGGTTTISELAVQNSGQTYYVPMTVTVGNSGFGTSVVDMNTATIDMTGGTLSNHFVVGSGTATFNLVNGATDQSLSGNIELSQPGDYAVINNDSSANLTVGNLTFDNVGPDPIGYDDRAVLLNAYGTGSIILDGTYTSPALTNSQYPTNGQNGASTLFIGQNGNQNGNYYITPTANFANMETLNVDGKGAIWMFSGNLYIENSSFTDQTIAIGGPNISVNIIGGQTLNVGFYVNIETNVPYDANGDTTQTPDGEWSMSQTTADLTNINGGTSNVASGFTMSVVDGGRLVFNSDMGGYLSNSITTQEGTYNEPGSGTIVKTGAGTVVFDNPNGNDYQTPNGVVADIQQGTLLVNNSQGYGMGTSSGTVKVEKGATFGGSATLASGQTVVSEDKGSIIAPGDAGQANLGIAPTIGTLNLTGGLTTASNTDPTNDGVTLDFKLNGDGGATSPANNPGVNNDYLVVNTMTLNGTITINLSALGSAPLLTGYGNFYILMQGSGAWVGDPTFVINAPAGYALDPTFGRDDGLGDGNDLGYIYENSAEDLLAVQLIAVPEPSTYALMGLGLLASAFPRLTRNPKTS